MDAGRNLNDSGLLAHHQYTTWELIKSYWHSPYRLSAYLFIFFILVMTVTLVAFDVIFTYWYNYFYNALQAYNKYEVIRLLILFFALAGVYIVLAVYRFYVAQLFGLRWRRWLTEKFVERWLKNRGYYYLENFDEKTDNPDQRIQEDIGSLVTMTIDLSIGIISASTTFFAFIYVLWSLSGIIHLPLGPLGTLAIPGYLVWVCVLYAMVGTFITFKIGYPLVGLNFEQQRREATFRYAAIDLRSHSENVALYQGENHQKNILHRLFNRVINNWYFIIVRQKMLLWFTAGYNQVAVVLPLMVALPNYFNKVFLLGGLMQTLSAFGKVQDSVSFLVNSYNQIAVWRAVNQRLITFLNHLNAIEEKAEKENKLQFDKKGNNTISVVNTSIETPRNELLLKEVNETFNHGSHYLIKGDSGIGKSTFIRAIAGIWPFASGSILLPQDQKIMYLPQKPYMPIGTLAEAILFPDKKNPQLAEQLEDVLRASNLEDFIPRLYETATWSEQLSPGEQQRIAFARVLLHRPDWVFMDESTSMLDLGNEKYLYRLLKEQLPDCSIISVGHRPSLDAYHDHILDLTKYSAKLSPSMA